MPASLLLALIIGGSPPVLEPVADTTRPAAVAPVAAPAADPAPIPAGAESVPAEPRLAGLRAAPIPLASFTPLVSFAPLDTVRRRKAVELSEWYERRLMVHRITAYTVPALFAWQWYKGQKLYTAANGGDPAPAGTRDDHSLGAGIITAAFAINTVTGVWNLWDTRTQSAGRTARWVHAVSMFAAEAGFAYAGIKLADDAEHLTGQAAVDARRDHRTIALTSMGVTMASGIYMWVVNHR